MTFLCVYDIRISYVMQIAQYLLSCHFIHNKFSLDRNFYFFFILCNLFFFIISFIWFKCNGINLYKNIIYRHVKYNLFQDNLPS